MLRSSAWVRGEFVDQVLLGLLVQDWHRDGWQEHNPQVQLPTA